jgi:hypothetical protein
MNQQESLSEIERKAYRSTFDDGLLEITVGLMALLLAWIPVFDSIGIPRVVGYLFLVIPMAIPLVGKRVITNPRLGIVEFRSKRKSRRLGKLLLLAVVVNFMLPVVLLVVVRGQYGGPTWPIVALIAAPLVAIAAYSLDYPRAFIYVAVMAFAVAEAEFLLPLVGSPLNSLLSFGLIGAALLLAGLALLTRFVHKYPKPPAEAHHVG